MSTTSHERLRPFPRFWDEPRETLSLAARRDVILERLQAQLRHVHERNPFYRRLYDAHGVRPEQIRSLEDFTAKVPVVTKQMIRDDQAAHPPFGSYSTTPPQDVARVFGSSGTTGTPTLYAISKADWSRAAEAQAMAVWGMGVRPGDIVQLAFPFSMFIGGWALLLGVERVGATAFSVGALDSRRQVELIGLTKSTVLMATPSYVMHLADVARGLGVDLRRSSIHTLIVGGEPGGGVHGSKEAMKAAWGSHVTICDTGNTSECFPTQMNSSCHLGTGMHVYEDETYLEIVSPENLNESVPDGEFGATVYTTLWRESQPMIRFAAGDRARLSREPCGCGRTFPRLPEGLVGRLDDTLLIRGVNVYPSAIEASLRQIPGVGAEYRVFVEKAGAMDSLRIEVEADRTWLKEQGGDESEAQSRLVAKLAEELRHDLSIRVDVQLVAAGTFEPMVFKARRVIDKRTAST
jgi:phenylacetate-CoA ligase